jgi:hypothetical protein
MDPLTNAPLSQLEAHVIMRILTCIEKLTEETTMLRRRLTALECEFELTKTAGRRVHDEL